MARGLFVGLITLDFIYQVAQVPTRDEKVVAQDALLVAGGPATNAAVTFGHFGHQARVMGALGQHPVTSLVHADLAAHGVEVMDLSPDATEPPPLSTILVTAATGDRAIISRNAVGRQLAPPSNLADYLSQVDIVLIDGHQMAVGLAVARLARQRDIPIVVDAGSWKPGFEELLPLATSAIAAAKFRLPPALDAANPRLALSQLGIPEVATTHGDDPIQFYQGGQAGTVAVPPVPVKDTLGAGDIFHGAFCHYRLDHSFRASLAQAAQVAAQSCRYFGPRVWMSADVEP
ncbi:MAG: PfkB family carbohydrate kinase [Nodosilinea sp.]